MRSVLFGGMVRAGEFVDKPTTGELFPVSKERRSKIGLVRDLNPGPLAPKARIIPLDQRATVLHVGLHSIHPSALNRLQDEPADSFLVFSSFVLFNFHPLFLNSHL